MIVANTLNVVDVAIANVAAGGNIGTAAATVDVASSFSVNQTTANQNLTLPNPTVTTPAGQLAVVKNAGTAQFSMHGIVIRPTTGSVFQWNGAAWIPLSDVSQPAALIFQQAAVALAANTALVINHNLGLATPTRVQVQITDANGNAVDLKLSAFTANSVSLTSPVALTNLTVVVVGG